MAWLPLCCRSERCTVRVTERYDISKDYPGSFFAVVHHQLAKISGRARKDSIAEFGKTPSEICIGNHKIDLFVELVDDFRGSVLGRAQTLQPAGARDATWTVCSRGHRGENCFRSSRSCSCRQSAKRSI